MNLARISPIAIVSIVFLLLANPVFADNHPSSVHAASFIGSVTLWIAIIIGLLASGTTLYYFYIMRDSLIGQILCMFGLGMGLIVIGFAAVVIEWSIPSYQKLVHDLLFIAGYVLLLVGATRIRKLQVSK